MKLKKWHGNPILTPTGKGYWEKEAVLNPGAWYEDGKVHLLYRASGEFDEYKIYAGLAVSDDGFNFKRVSEEPVIAPAEEGFDAGCIEDPRIVKFDDEFIVTYAARAFPPHAFWAGKGPTYSEDAPLTLTENLTRSGVLRSKDLITYERLGPITDENVDDRDAILFPEKINGKYVMLHRPQGVKGQEMSREKPGIRIAYSDNLLDWENSQLLCVPEFEWDAVKIGGSTPPLRTEQGWLMIYHGVDANNIYRAGVMMLDLDDPGKVIARCPHPILEPEADFEKEGLIKNVVFPTGNVVIDGTLFVYYGAADKVCCVATVPFDEFVDYVMTFKI